MKKLICLILSMLIFTQVAVAAEPASLKQAMDEFHFAMTVEWDQHNQSFAQAETEKFEQAIEALQLSPADIKMALSEISTTDMDQVIAELTSQDLRDPALVRNYIEKRMSVGYKRGASWDFDTIGGVLAGALMVFILGSLAFRLATCGKNGRPQC